MGNGVDHGFNYRMEMEREMEYPEYKNEREKKEREKKERDAIIEKSIYEEIDTYLEQYKSTLPLCEEQCQHEGLKSYQIETRRCAIDKLIHDTRVYLDDAISNLEYDFIDIPEEITIKVNRWLPDISEYFKFLTKKSNYQCVTERHWLNNYEILDFIKEYAEENSMTLDIVVEPNAYVFTLNTYKDAHYKSNTYT